MSKEVNVHIGEVKVVKANETLKALLGSCVGIGIIWKSAGVCGLAHCLLPEAPARSFVITGRFVDQAIPSLLAMMKIRAENYPELVVVVAGGGDIMGYASDPGELVGTNNFRVAERELKKLGLKADVWDVGGNEGRRLSLRTDGTYVVEKIPRIINAS